MKFLKLSTTSKLYLLTLLLIFGIIFVNQSVFAQTQSPSTTSSKRVQTMELYLSWVNNNEYGQFNNEPGTRLLANFKSFLTKAVPEDKACLTGNAQQEPQSSTFIDNIQNFFANLTGNEAPPQSPAAQTSCKGKILEDYKLAKKYNRALKYLQIEAGQPNICVKADLGIGTALKAKGFNPTKTNSDNPKETGVSSPLPLYLCTGNDGKKKVRVLDDSGTRLRLAPEDAAKDQFKVENLPPAGSFEQLLKKLGQ